MRWSLIRGIPQEEDYFSELKLWVAMIGKFVFIKILVRVGG